MARNKGKASKVELGGKEFPLHQLRKSWRFAAGGALVSLFFIPLSVYAFQETDPSSLHARSALIFSYVTLFIWTSGWLTSTIKYRALVRSKYTNSQLAPENGRLKSTGNWIRWILAWASGISWAITFSVGHIEQHSPHSIKVSAGLLIISYLSGMIALLLTGILSAGAGLRSEALRLEEARGLRDEIQAHEARLEDKTDSIAQSLSERIYSRISDLEALSGEIGHAERTKKAIQNEIKSGNQELYRGAFKENERRNLRQQWMFVTLSFFLGFVVNWLSSPALDLFRRIHF